MSQHESASKKLIIDREGPVTTVTLNRPEVHNALDREMLGQLHETVREISVDQDCRVVVFRGAGETFCAGDDMSEFQEWDPQEGYWPLRRDQDTLSMIEDLVPVTIAAVDGVCLGGGLELTLVCDFVIATDRSRWGMPEINWGITPGWGGTSRLTKVVGRRKAKEWNLIGRLFDAATAERYDLINRISAPDRLEHDVNVLVDSLVEKSPYATRCTKYFLNKAAELSGTEGLWLERAPQRPVPGLQDPVAGRRGKRRAPTGSLWSE
jgi:enoyl-CoA hydratase